MLREVAARTSTVRIWSSVAMMKDAARCVCRCPLLPLSAAVPPPGLAGLSVEFHPASLAGRSRWADGWAVAGSLDAGAEPCPSSNQVSSWASPPQHCKQHCAPQAFRSLPCFSSAAAQPRSFQQRFVDSSATSGKHHETPSSYVSCVRQSGFDLILLDFFHVRRSNVSCGPADAVSLNRYSSKSPQTVLTWYFAAHPETFRERPAKLRPTHPAARLRAPQPICCS